MIVITEIKDTIQFKNMKMKFELTTKKETAP